MPERHRGPHPQDDKCFDALQIGRLREAVHDLSWLLNRGYSIGASNELVGDHHQLTSRQRLAVARIACSDTEVRRREAKRVPLGAVKGKTVLIDGFNLLITLETALGGGVVFTCVDGCCRDLSSVYGSYKIVEETRQAVLAIGRTLAAASPLKVRWLFDRPVSNSGRIAALVRELAQEQGWPFEAELTDGTDSLLAESDAIVVTCDSAILERCRYWCNLACLTLSQQVPDARVLDLRG